MRRTDPETSNNMSKEKVSRLTQPPAIVVALRQQEVGGVTLQKPAESQPQQGSARPAKIHIPYST